MSDLMLQVRELRTHFPIRRGLLSRVTGWERAVDGVSFRLGEGEVLGLVGESGSGKTTLGRTILRLLPPGAGAKTSGHIVFQGKDVLALRGAELRALRRDMQIVFQDPDSSLNPRLDVRTIVGEAPHVHRVARGIALEELLTRVLERVGLRPEHLDRYPHELSGGQRQRVGIARAIALNPRFIVCDEVTSALDVSVQAQILNLLADLRDDLGLSYLFISHDLAVVRHIADHIAVMYLGRIVETGPSQAVFSDPLHPYTQALLSAIPRPVPGRPARRIALDGDPPSGASPPAGCAFHPRCPLATERCQVETPTLGAGHSAACHLVGDP